MMRLEKMLAKEVLNRFMSEGEVYCIINLEKYSDFIRRRAADDLAQNHGENLDEFVTIPQTMGMIKENSIGIDEQDRLMLDDKAYEELLEAVTKRIYNSGLAKLASKNLIECAWDDEKNEMVFWSK